MGTQRILIVDDDRDFAESIGEVLEEHGYSVELVFSGEEAIRTFREQDFTVTFMDVRMPGLNGVETFYEFRKIRPDAKVVTMTAYRVEQLLEEAINNGDLGVLHKPFGMEDMLRVIEKTIERTIERNNMGTQRSFIMHDDCAELVNVSETHPV